MKEDPKVLFTHVAHKSGLEMSLDQTEITCIHIHKTRRTT
jgi:hypothetical protein